MQPCLAVQSPLFQAAVGRVLHLLDLENLAGTPRFSIADAQRIHDAYVAVAPLGGVNQMVVATSHFAAPAAWFGFPSHARRLVRSGTDGADLALVELLETEADRLEVRARRRGFGRQRLRVPSGPLAGGRV